MPRKLVLPLVTALKEFRARQQNISGKVFRYGVPKAVTLLKDLAACGIKGVDEHGRHLDSSLEFTDDSTMARIAALSGQGSLDHAVTTRDRS